MTRCIVLRPREGCRIQGVGMRPALMSEACEYHVKVCSVNLPDGESVMVWVEGKNADQYVEHVKSNGVVPSNPQNFKCTDYQVEDCDVSLRGDYYEYCGVAVMAEQVGKIFSLSRKIVLAREGAEKEV